MPWMRICVTCPAGTVIGALVGQFWLQEY